MGGQRRDALENLQQCCVNKNASPRWKKKKATRHRNVCNRLFNEAAKLHGRGTRARGKSKGRVAFISSYLSRFAAALSEPTACIDHANSNFTISCFSFYFFHGGPLLRCWEELGGAKHHNKPNDKTHEGTTTCVNVFARVCVPSPPPPPSPSLARPLAADLAWSIHMRYKPALPSFSNAHIVCKST